MNGKIIIPVIRYYNGTAAMNRLIGYAKGFAQQGVDVYLFFFVTNSEEEKLVINHPNIHVVNLWENDSSYLKKRKSLELVKNTFLFRKYISKGDTLFLYGRLNYMFFVAKTISKKVNTFCEITEHPEYRGKSFFHSISVSFSLYFIKRLNGLFVISHSLKDYFTSKGVKESHVHLVNMFVDSLRFDNIEKRPSEKYIAYCGYVSIKKDGVDTLIKAFATFYQNHKDYKLYIIGKGGFPEPITYFEKLAAEHGVKDRVVFTGEVKSNEMPPLLKNASIMALSRPDSIQARNGFPTKLGEYLATGNPVVVTEVGEIPLYIKDRYNGVLAKESDADDFAEKLSWVADNPKEAAQIGINGKKLVEKEFSNVIQSQKALKMMFNE